MPLYNVLRQHLGDKMYMAGDKRTAAASDVAHLVANGVLELALGKKAEAALSNKAEPSAPMNKQDVASAKSSRRKA